MLDLSLEQVSQAIKYQYMVQPFAVLALVFGRVSFAVSLLKIIGITSRLRRWMLYQLIIGQFVINLIFIGLFLGHCTPVEKYWNPSIPGTCMNIQPIEYAGYVQGCKSTRTMHTAASKVLLILNHVSVEYIHRFRSCATSRVCYFETEYEAQDKGWSGISYESGNLVSPPPPQQAFRDDRLTACFSNMAAAIVTVVEATKIGAFADFTCKSLNV